MGRIVTPVIIANVWDASCQIKCDILVDTGTSSLILPKAWKQKLGGIHHSRTIKMETADQRVTTGEVCGPVRVQIKGFKPVFNEVTFIDMEPRQGRYEPLLGYVILEQSQAAVDMTRHRLKHIRYMDLKLLTSA